MEKCLTEAVRADLPGMLGQQTDPVERPGFEIAHVPVPCWSCAPK